MRRAGILLLLSCCLLLSGCRGAFADFVNYGFSRPALRSVFEFCGGAVVESNIEPLFDAPVIVLGNGVSEIARVEIPDGPYILAVGNPYAIGELPGQSCLSRLLGWQISELSSIILYDIDADEDDNDAEQILLEIVTGASPSLREETVPGISGVALVGIGPGSYTLAFDDGNATDTLTLAGPGLGAVLEKLDSPADATDDVNALSLIDVETDTVVLGDRANNPVYAAAGSRLEGREEIEAFLEAVLGEAHMGIDVIGVDAGSVSMFVSNAVTGTRDLFVFSGVNPR
jgi:hypothetical protein